MTDLKLFDNKFMTYRKDSELIKTMVFKDENGLIVNYSSNEMKMFEYLTYKVQKKYFFEKTKLPDFKMIDKTFYMIDKDNNRHETFKISLDKSELKEFLGNRETTRLLTILGGLNTKSIHSKSSSKHSINYLISKIDIDSETDEIDININIVFVYNFLNSNLLKTDININHIRDMKSKYSIRFYEEFRRILSNSHGKNFNKSEENMRLFLGNDKLKYQDIERIIYRMKKEFLEKKLFKFDYTKIKNKKSKIWSFYIENIKEIDSTMDYTDIVDCYLDYTLVSDDIREEIDSNSFGSLGDMLDEKEKRNIENKTRFLNKKKK